MKKLLITLLVYSCSTPIWAKEACVIIYAKDMGRKITKEIRDHEYAHCNGWQHPPGWATHNKAFVPHKKFLRKYRGNVYETPVTTFEARARCEGQLGCTRMIQE